MIDDRRFHLSEGRGEGRKAISLEDLQFHVLMTGVMIHGNIFDMLYSGRSVEA